jgi:hypothetical protein
MRRILWSILVLLLVAPPCAADEDAAPVVAAAVSSARDNLLSDVLAEQVTPTLSVGDFLDRTHSTNRLVKALQDARPVGGPRWLDNQTCQVRVDIPGKALKLVLWRITIDSPSDPITPDEMAHDLNEWDLRIFSATGTSTARLDAVRPPANSVAWKNASDQDIRAAVQAARSDAVTHVMDSLSQIPLTATSRIGDAFAIEPVRRAMIDWLDNCPITLVDFQEDRRVRLALAVTPENLCNELRSLVAERRDVAVPSDNRGWSIVLASIQHQMSAAGGRAAPVGDARAGIPAASQPRGLALPDQPPDWTAHRLIATATGRGRNSLRAASAAEAIALHALREKVYQLPIGHGATLSDAADSDPDLAAAIDGAVTRNCHVETVEYIGDRVASVRLVLNLQDLWDGIQRK